MSWKSLVDKALGTDFDKPQYDPEVGRKKLVRQIDLAAKQHTEGTTRAPNRAWRSGGTTENPSVRFTAKVDGKPVLLDGDESVYVPASRFQDFLKHLKTSVEAGELDKEIKAALDGQATNKLGVPRAPRGPSSGLGAKSQPDNPEWMGKFTAKHGPAPSDDHVPNSKGTAWVTRDARARGERAAAARAANR